MLEITAVICCTVLILSAFIVLLVALKTQAVAQAKVQAQALQQQRYMFDMLVNYADPSVQTAITELKAIRDAQAAMFQRPDDATVEAENNARANALAQAQLNALGGGAMPIDDNL